MAKTPPRKPPPMPPSPHTGRNIKHLAAEGLSRPSTLNAKQVRELAGSVMRHIEPRTNNAPPPKPPSKPRGKPARGR